MRIKVREGRGSPWYDVDRKSPTSSRSFPYAQHTTTGCNDEEPADRRCEGIGARKPLRAAQSEEAARRQVRRNDGLWSDECPGANAAASDANSRGAGRTD